MRSLAGWTVPALPLKGGDVVARGIAAGPEVARLLRAVEAAWVAEDFPDAARVRDLLDQKIGSRSEEHTSELQSLMRISYAVFCLKKKTNKATQHSKIVRN